MKREEETRNMTEGIPGSVSVKAPEGGFLHPPCPPVPISKDCQRNRHQHADARPSCCNAESQPVSLVRPGNSEGASVAGEEPARTKRNHVRRER